MNTIILVSSIPILIQEIKNILIERYPEKSIKSVKSLEHNLFLSGNDLLMIYVSEWSGRLLSILKRLQAKQVKIIIWFDSSRKDIATSFLKEGFDGYVPHDVAKEELIFAINSVLQKNFYIHKDLVNILYSEYLKKIRLPETIDPVTPDSHLTTREREVLKQMTQGYSNETISKNLCITIYTVKNHVSSILKKLQVPSRNAAIVKAIQNNWVVE